jgi:hypothetical protein
MTYVIRSLNFDSTTSPGRRASGFVLVAKYLVIAEVPATPGNLTRNGPTGRVIFPQN